MKKKLIAIVIIAVAVIVAVMGFSTQMRNSLDTVKANYTYFEDCIDAKGLVVRFEDIYSKDKGTVFESEKKEGVRISAGGKIGTVYGEDAPKSVIDKITGINGQIAEIEKKETGLEAIYEDVSKVDAQMASLTEELRNSAQNMDGDSVGTYKYELDRLMDYKLVLEGKEPDTSEELSALKAQRAELEKNLEKTDIISRTSGVLTYMVDGFEQILTPDLIDDMTPEAVDAWLEYSAKPESSHCAKTISNNAWYFMFNMTVNQLDNMKVGDSAYIKTTLESTDLIPVIVYDLSEPSEDGRVSVVLECRRDVNAAFTARKLDLIFVKKIHEGYQIPKTAVHVNNDVVGVYALMSGIVEFRPVNIVYSGDDHIMIDYEYDEKTNAIRMYDDIIVDTQNIKEGMLFT